MSKITYCSLEEAWGKTYKEASKDESTNVSQDKKYNNLVEKSDSDRNKVINNLNTIEKNVPIENNSIVEYNKYRFNPDNNVKSSESQLTYSPFNESLEKKYLKDKLFFLENEFRKYKTLFDNDSKMYNQQQSYINEHFSNNDLSSSNINTTNNQQYNKNNNTNDMIDLILLIVIGLIIILVMNSIFNIGKSIGARQQKVM
jgi:hypothetical protein